MQQHKDIICFCKNISRKTIEEAIGNGAKTLKEIQKATTACTGNRCHELNPKGICCSGEIVKILPKHKNDNSCCCG